MEALKKLRKIQKDQSDELIENNDEINRNYQ